MKPDKPADTPCPPTGRERHGGIIHAYLGYDPTTFPPPSAPGGDDLATAALEHMLAHGSMREFTERELADAIRLDPSMFPKLGPSLDSLIAILEERKRRILQRYETSAVRRLATEGFDAAARAATPPERFAHDFHQAVRGEQIPELERLWYRQKDEQSPFARELLRVLERLAEKFQIEQLAGRYAFIGREELDVPRALALKQELEAIDALLAQLREAMKNAKLAIIDMEQLGEFADPEQIRELNELQRQIEEWVRQEAERQGVERANRGFRLTPRAYALFQGRVLGTIFSGLRASRTGRHEGPVGEGAVETTKTKPYEFGDSPAHMDVAGSFINAMIRERGETGRNATPGATRLTPADIVIHRTRNAPKCATCVLMDMSGSMRYGGQYVHVKRMALAFDGLIRREFPGDHLSFFELFTFARACPPAQVAAIMPKPVSIHEPVVRLRVNMGDPHAGELRVPQHFTNIQRGLELARRTLAAQDTPNRQIVLITDGLPTAHFEGQMLYLLYPPDPRTEHATMREASLCAREGITINIFLLPSWSQTEEDVRFAHRMAQSTKGRVFFTAGRDLDRFVLWDYVSQRRRIIG